MSKLKLIGLPHAGGSASSLAQLGRHVASHSAFIDFLAIDLPGRATRYAEPLHVDRRMLVQQLAAELAPQLLGIRYALFGHSLGAWIAYELAHALMARTGIAPNMLFIAAAAAPSMRPELAATRGMSDADLEAELRRRGGTPPELFDHPELVELFLPVVRADFQLCEAPSPRGLPPLPCPVHVYGGLHDAVTDTQLGAWRAETSRSFSLTWFDGDHFFVRAHAAALSGEIRQRLTLANDLPNTLARTVASAVP